MKLSARNMLKGKVKQAAGDLTDNQRLHDEGQVDEAAGNVQEGFGRGRRGGDVEAVRRHRLSNAAHARCRLRPAEPRNRRGDDAARPSRRSSPAASTEASSRSALRRS